MPVLEQSLLRDDASVKDAIAIINSSPLKIAIVVDAERRLLGMATDGDVRRGLLRGLSLEARVTEVMNANPVVIRENESPPDLAARMRNKRGRPVPVVDERGRILRLESVGSQPVPRRDNIVFLFAGGFGQRLRPLTATVPKPMLPVGGKPLLEQTLERFIAAGFSTFYISVYYLAESVMSHFGDGSAWGVKINYVREDRPLGTAGSLSLLPEKPTAPMIVMNGDILSKLNFGALLDFHTEHAASATLCLREFDFQVPYGTVEVEGDRMMRIIEKPVHKVFVNAGIYVLSPSTLSRVPPNTTIDMPTLLDSVTQANEKVCAFPVHEYWIDIGRFEDFDRAQLELDAP